MHHNNWEINVTAEQIPHYVSNIKSLVKHKAINLCCMNFFNQCKRQSSKLVFSCIVPISFCTNFLHHFFFFLHRIYLFCDGFICAGFALYLKFTQHILLNVNFNANKETMMNFFFIRSKAFHKSCNAMLLPRFKTLALEQ